MSFVQDVTTDNRHIAAGANDCGRTYQGFGLKRIEQLKMPALYGPSTATIHLITFDHREFSASAFDAFQVPLPAVIGRSVTKRQAEYCFGRVAARLALIPFGLGHIEVASGPAREPLWPPLVTGSITHSQRHAGAVAIQQHGGAGIGIDIETVAPESMRDAITASVISTQELQYLRSLENGLDLDLLLTIAFSVKESFYKAAYQEVMKFFDFYAVRITHFSLQRRSVTFELCQTLSPRLLAGSLQLAQFSMIDRHTVMTICNIQ